MKFGSKFTISAAVLGLALASAPVMAQDSPAQPPAANRAPAAQAKTVQGELLKVDTDKKLLRIKAADNKEMEFRFTTETEVTGEGQNIEGLATKTGTKVSVDYRGEGSNMVATKIAIQAAEARPSAPAPAPSAPPQ